MSIDWGLEYIMDPRLFEQAPEIAPILVRLYDSHRLYSLAKDGTPLARAELTGAVVELLDKDLAPREQELISDVLISLLRQAEQDLRQAIAERLAVMDAAPFRVILHIANDDIDVAAPVLRNSPVLSDLDLLYIIKGKTTEYWQAIAGRKFISENVMNVLVETKDLNTLIALSKNDNIRLTRKALNVMGDVAETSEDLAQPLLMRVDVPEDLARRLYAFVGQEMKRYIRDYYGLHDLAALSAVDDIVLEFATSDEHASFMPSPSVIEAADLYVRTGRLNLQTIMDVLHRGQITTFVAMFSRYSGMDYGRIHDILADPSGKVLAILCKALDITKSDLSRIYLMTQRVRSTNRLVDHKDMLRCLSVYDRVTSEKAREMIGVKKS